MTTGQLAKYTGMTIRTLRYYDKIGLLSPSDRLSGSTRRYSKEDLNRLQRIQTLKYVGLSLQEIQDVLSADGVTDQDTRHSLQAQIEILRQKIAHTENVVHAIRKALDLMSDEPMEWDYGRLLEIIQALHSELRWGEQFRTAARLQTRIQLYDKFSTNPQGWQRWVFEQLEQWPNAHILELGCGDGTLWKRNVERIPEGWRITLSDASQGMIEEAQCNIGTRSPQFKFLKVDAQQIPFHDEQFDIVIANNLLYHVTDIPGAIGEMHRVLKNGGMLYASTMSKAHLQEMEHLAISFDPVLRVLDDVIDRFHFDNGAELLSAFFADVQLLRYDDHLQVTEAEALIDYAVSTPMNARARLAGETMDNFRNHVNQILHQQNGVFEMTKENGMFKGRK
jgi:ubiquinone/menaquinone biosynthesis C-methylase UbiE/DNA-binding transcriptional MerR regulator